MKERKLIRGILLSFQPRNNKEVREKPIEYTVLTICPIDEDNDEPVEFLFYEFLPNAVGALMLGELIEIIQEPRKSFLRKSLTQKISAPCKFESNRESVYQTARPYSYVERVKEYHEEGV